LNIDLAAITEKTGFSLYLSFVNYNKTNQKSFYVYLRFYLKLGNKYRLQHTINLEQNLNNRGSTKLINNVIYFKKRNVCFIENTFFTAYSFSNNIGISIRKRHYCSGLHNKLYYQLYKWHCNTLHNIS